MARPDRPLVGNATAVVIALVIAVLVALFAPHDDGIATVPTSTERPHPTIALDDLRGGLTDALDQDPPPAAVDIAGTNGDVVTVLIPPDVTVPIPPPATTTAPTTTSPPPRAPQSADEVVTSILDQLLDQTITTTTIPEGDGGEQ